VIPRFSPDYRWADLLDFILPASKSYYSKIEKEFADRTGHKYVHFFKYGRTGLYYLLKAMGVKNKKVILPSYTCIVVPYAISLSGNIPIFLDNEEGQFQPNPDSYFNAIDEDTVMVIPTHLFGISQETSELYKKIKRHYPSVFVLQDCAHSFFCTDSTGKCVTEYGDGAMFGMNISKLVNSVKGGALTLKDKTLSEKVNEVYNNESPVNQLALFFESIKMRIYYLLVFFAFMPIFYRWVYWLQKNTKLLSSETDYYSSDKVELPRDFRNRFTAFQAKVGYKSLLRFDNRVENRKVLAKKYIDLLSGMGKGWMFPKFNEGYTWSHFPLAQSSDQFNRFNLKNRLEKLLGSEIGEFVDYSCQDLQSYKSSDKITAKHALALSNKILNLPLTTIELKSSVNLENLRIGLIRH
jgi:dTDP-4-amino-4,6-dideoxygalactose transaminase